MPRTNSDLPAIVVFYHHPNDVHSCTTRHPSRLHRRDHRRSATQTCPSGAVAAGRSGDRDGGTLSRPQRNVRLARLRRDRHRRGRRSARRRDQEPGRLPRAATAGLGTRPVGRALPPLSRTVRGTDRRHQQLRHPVLRTVRIPLLADPAPFFRRPLRGTRHRRRRQPLHRHAPVAPPPLKTGLPTRTLPAFSRFSSTAHTFRLPHIFRLSIPADHTILPVPDRRSAFFGLHRPTPSPCNKNIRHLTDLSARHRMSPLLNTFE